MTDRFIQDRLDRAADLMLDALLDRDGHHCALCGDPNLLTDGVCCGCRGCEGCVNCD